VYMGGVEMTVGSAFWGVQTIRAPWMVEFGCLAGDMVPALCVSK
jgi:hypothetical protein